MRNKVLLIFILAVLVSFTRAQRPKDLRISGITEVSHFSNGSLTSYGILVEYFLNKNFSMNYQYTFGTNQFGNFYAHFPGTVSWLVEAAKHNEDDYSTSVNDAWEVVLIATFAIPEGVCFHTYPRKWLEVAPFINPFSADYNILDNEHSTITASLGIRSHIKLTSHLSIVPHFGLKYIYKNNQTGTIYGIGLGWLF